MNKEEKLKISKMLREKDIDDKLEIYLSPDLYCYVHNYIVDLKMQIDQLTNNWNKLKATLNCIKDSETILGGEYYVIHSDYIIALEEVLDKMKEIKEGNKND